MKKKYLILAGSLLFASVAMQSCLDYDDPGDELGLGDIILEDEKPDTPEDSISTPDNFDELVKRYSAVDTLDYTR